MATCKTLTRNTEKYCRLAILTAKGCTEILRALVLHQMKLSTPAGTDWTVDDFLNNVFTQENKRKLSDKQHRILFPRGGGSTDIKRWDLSLLATILLDICQNVDSHVKMDVRKMKDIRNKVCHAEDAFTEDADFARYFNELKICIRRCLVFLGNDAFETEMLSLIRDVEHSAISMDESVRILHEWFKTDKRNEEQLERIEQDLQTIKSMAVNTNEKMDEVRLTTNTKMDEVLSMVKQLIQRHPNPDSIGVPDTPLDVDVKNCAAVEERKLSQILVDILNSKSENDPKLKKYVSDPEFEKILDAVNELKDHMLSGGRTITNAYAKCVILNIHCPNFDNFKDLVFQSSSGYINAMFRPVEKAIRSMESYEEVSLEAAISDEAFWTNMSTIVENILAAYGYSTDGPEAEPMDNIRHESDDPSDVIQGAELLPPDGTHDGTRIRINIKPRSMEHHDRIVDTVTSGSIRSTLDKLAFTMREYYHLNDLNIEAKLAELNTPSIEMKTNHSGMNNLSMKTQLEKLTAPPPVQDIQEYLISQYKRDAFDVSKCPILRTHGVNVDDIYTQLPIVERPDMFGYWHDTLYGLPATVDTYKDVLFDDQTASKNIYIETYKDVLFDGQAACENVYVVGKAGMGKTTWCKKLVATWVKAKENMGKQWVPDVNESFLRDYDFVFYIPLRHTTANIDVMHQLFPNRPDLLSAAKTLLNNADVSSRCIVILDGLDDWSRTTFGIPGRVPTWQCSVIITTRFLSKERPTYHMISERVVELQGFNEYGTNKLIENIVSRLNKNKGTNIDPTAFKSHISKSFVKTLLDVPVLLTMFVCLWYDGVEIKEHLTGAYGDLVEMLLLCAERDQNSPTEMLVEMKMKWQTENNVHPECLSDRCLLVAYLPFLLRLGKVAFETLFSKQMEPTMVFDYETITQQLSDDELQLSEQIGFLAGDEIPVSTNINTLSPRLSFLHKNIQEYLAALYVTSGNNKSECLNTLKMHCMDANDVQKIEQSILFICGMCPETAREISCYISEMEPDARIHQILLRCWRETSVVVDTNTPIYIKHHWLYDDKHPMSVYNDETLCYLSQKKDKKTSSHVEVFIEGCDGNTRNTLDLSECQSVTTLHYISSNVHIQVPNSLEEVHIDGCGVPLLSMFYMLLCQSPRYTRSKIRREFSNSLDEAYVDECEGSTENKLDLSGCLSLTKLHYIRSDLPIQVPNSLEEVYVDECYGISENKLDLSGCLSLKKLHYTRSNIPIQVPNSLKEVYIVDCEGSKSSMLDFSMCLSLTDLHYTQSKIDIRVPKNMEHVYIDGRKESARIMEDLLMRQSQTDSSRKRRVRNKPTYRKPTVSNYSGVSSASKHSDESSSKSSVSGYGSLYSSDNSHTGYKPIATSLPRTDRGASEMIPRVKSRSSKPSDLVYNLSDTDDMSDDMHTHVKAALRPKYGMFSAPKSPDTL